MTHTPFPIKPMQRLAHPEDVGHALRLAGRIGRQAGLSAARLRDLADIVRAMTIGLALDKAGGWIGVRQLSIASGPGVEVVAFDRVEYGDDGSVIPPGPWVTRLRSDLDRLGGLGLSVMTGATAAGGTAVWARVLDVPPRNGGGRMIVDASGLLQAPVAREQWDTGWSARTSRDHIGMVVAEDGLKGLTQATVDAAEIDEMDGTRGAAALERGRRILSGLSDASGALIDIDLAQHVAHIAWSGGIGVTAAVDGGPAPVGTPEAPPDGPVRELTLHWERTLSLVLHTSGIRSVPDLAPSEDRHPALTCATLMRDHRTEAAVACVAAARIRTLDDYEDDLPDAGETTFDL